MIQHSVLIPERGAAPQVAGLLAELCGVLSALGQPYEVICIDDASPPRERQLLLDLMVEWPCLRVLCLDRASGTSAALSAGIAAARGEVIMALEASGQYPATEISRLLQRLARADAVFGCRRAGLARRLWRGLSRLPRRLLLGQDNHDPGCLLWAARHEAVAGLQLSRGMHRFLPSIVARRGFRVGELHVSHLQRRGAARCGDGWPNPGDLLAAWWWRRRASPATVVELAPITQDGEPGLKPGLQKGAPLRETRIDPPEGSHSPRPQRRDVPNDDRNTSFEAGGPA